jgi:16S rRNA (cytosine967-C5)-methyltransferase
MKPSTTKTKTASNSRQGRPDDRPNKPAKRPTKFDNAALAHHPSATPHIAANITGMVAVQIAAAEIVGRVLGGKNLDRELADALTRHRHLSPNERQAVHSISFDTLRHYGLLNAQIDMLLAAPLTDAPVRHLLLVALSQLQFSRVAAHTVVDHAVNAAVGMGFTRAKGLANAVLRNYLRAPEKFSRERFKDQVAKYDHQRWWMAKLEAEQPQRWQQVLLAARARPPMHLRVNARKTTVNDYLALLAKEGMSATAVGSRGDAEVGIASDAAIHLDVPVSVSALPHFAEGWVSVQDIGAQLAAQLLDVRDGMRVLDACAAPGGKTCHILERTNCELVAIDTDKQRLKRVTDNLSRLQLNARTMAADVANLDMWWGEVDKRVGKKPFDRILLDVPCSGSGVTRRHPDIKWIRRETDLKRFAEQQLRLLQGVWPTLAKGGMLLYATCSVFAAENQDVIAQFLRAEKTARQVAISSIPSLHSQPTAIVAPAAQQPLDLLFLPDEQHDGFYYALLQKESR